MRRTRSILAGVLFALAAFAQSHASGPQVLTFLSDVDDSDQPYAIYLPKTFDPAKKYPLVISLHGASSNHRLNLRRVFGRGNQPRETDAEATRYFPAMRDIEFIVASPYARGTLGYQDIAERDVYAVLADVKRRFPIDEDRIYLTGLSMGGGGTLWLGLTRPDIWAAIAPVCPAVPDGTEDLASNALNVPVHLFHGDADPVVPVSVSRHWQKILLDSGGRAEYVEYPNVRHNSWDFAYRNGAIFDWFRQFHRDPHPARVRFVSRQYEYAKAYWVTLDSLAPGKPASIDARFTGRNRIEVVTRHLEGFTLELAGHPQFASGAPLVIMVDGVALRPRGENASFSKSGGAWKLGRAVPSAKRPGLEGPIHAAVASRHIYVYGTADSPGPEELKRRREIAMSAAQWPRLSLSFAVKADKDVNDADLQSANLVLFGTKETNRQIARLAPKLPLELNAGAADFGLLYIAPGDNGHYVLVNSGLPFWTGAGQEKRPVYRDLPEKYRVLLGFQDYVVFKGSLENIVAEGLFDRDWKVPAADAAKMKDTGALSIP